MDGTTAASGATQGGQVDTATPICHLTGGAELAPALGAAPRPKASAQGGGEKPTASSRQSSSAEEHFHMPFAATEYPLGSMKEKSQRYIHSLMSHLLLAAPVAYGTPKSRPLPRLRRSLKEKKGGVVTPSFLPANYLTPCLLLITTKTDMPFVHGGGWGTAGTGWASRHQPTAPSLAPSGCLGQVIWGTSPFSYTDCSCSGAAELT